MLFVGREPCRLTGSTADLLRMTIPIAPSTYYEQKGVGEKDPSAPASDPMRSATSNSAARFVVYGKRTLTSHWRAQGLASRFAVRAVDVARCHGERPSDA